MATVSRVLQRLEQKAVAAESLIAALTNELARLEKNGYLNTKAATLQKENESLKVEVESWKRMVLEADKTRGSRSYCTSTTSSPPQLKPQTNDIQVAAEVPKKEVKKESKKKDDAKVGKPKEVPLKADAEEGPVDIGRIDLRVGKIVSCKKHPDADSLYVEEVDVGEANPRTVVSGLVKHVPLEEMINRVAIFMCNLKPAKMRGITSEGMLMCASSPDKVEILLPPANAVPGDVVEVEGYTRRPDAVLNPKKKVWEMVAPDLKVSESGMATFKGTTLVILNKGPITSPSLVNVQIK